MSKDRGEYTWADAERDLALMTHLNLDGAVALVWPIKDMIHPYDAVPPLVELVQSFKKQAHSRVGASLLKLMEAVQE